MRNFLLLISLLLMATWPLDGRSLTEPGGCHFAQFSEAAQRTSAAVLTTVGGTIRREDGSPVPGVTVQLSGDASQTVVTDAMGNYELTGLVPGGNYAVTPVLEERCRDCVSISDVLAINNHILGVAPLSSPYQLIAADVDRSQTIATTDVVQMLRLIQNISTSWPNNTCWRFIPAEYMFPDPANPFLEPFPEVYTITDFAGPLVVDWVAVNTGDVDGCAETLAEPGELELSLISNSFFCPGDIMEVQVRIRNFVEIRGLQFSLAWNPAVLGLQYSSNFSLLDGFSIAQNLNTQDAADGSLSLAWTNQLDNGLSIPGGASIITFGFEVLAGAGSDVDVVFSNTPTPVLYATTAASSLIPATADFLDAVPGPRLGVGLPYCYDNQQLIPFLPTYVTEVVNQGPGTLSGLPVTNGQTFWLTDLGDSEDWSLQVTGRAADGFCTETVSGQTATCTEPLTPACAPSNLSNSADNILSAAVWGNKVVWHSDVDGDNEIYVYDLATQSLTNITNNTADDRDPIIQGDRIVYRSDADGDFEIMLYNCVTEQITQISNNDTPVDTTHDIDGNYIVWRSNFEGDNDIYLYNLLNGQLTNVSDDDATGAGECSVAGEYVVFISTETGSNDVYRYRISDGTKTNLTNDAAAENQLVMNHRYAAWVSDADGDADIYVVNLFTGQVTNASNNDLEEAQPVLGTDKTVPLDLVLSWVTNNMGTEERYFYEIGTGTTTLIGTTQGNAPAAVQGGRIVWRDGGNLLVYQLLDGLLTNYPTFPGDFPSLHNNHLVWTNNGDIFWYDLALPLPESAQFDELNSFPIIPCAGRQATLLLEGPTDWEAVWYADAALTEEVYADAANNFQPVVEGPATYYGQWRDPRTGCTGAAVAVEVDATDDIPPTLTNCPESQTVQAAPGEDTAVATWMPPTGGDNCNIRIDNNFGPGEAFPIGTTTVTYIASDFAGNTTECSFDITVERSNPEPVEFTLSNAAAQVDETVCIDLTAINFSDIDGFQFTIEYDPALLQFVSVQDDVLTGVNFSLVTPGLVSLQWIDFTGQSITLPDGSRLAQICFEALATGNVGVLITGTAIPIEVTQAGMPAPSVGNPGTITITPGMATCPPDQLVDNDPGRCDAFVDIPLPATAGLQIVSNDYNDGIDASDTYPVGSTDVTYSFFNSFTGETTSCTFNVTVRDVEAPTLVNCPANQTIQADPGASTAVATWTEPTANDNCEAILTGNFSPGEPFPIGTTTVIYTATDPAGNTAPDCTFDITVEATEEPVVFEVGSGTATVGDGVCVEIIVRNFLEVEGLQFTIEYDETLVEFAGWQEGALSGVMLNTVTPGTLNLSWFSLDGLGVSLPDGSVLVELCFDALAVGNTPVEITSSSSPLEVVRADMVVEATTAPGSILIMAGMATCPPDQLVDNDSGQCEAFVQIPPPSTAGQEIIDNDYNGTTDASDVYPVGSTDVTYRFLDPLTGDTSFCTFNVTVVDVEPPIIDCAGSIVLIGDLAAGGAFLSQELAVADDNCPNVDIFCEPLPREGFWACGITEVSCRAVDEAGNESEPCLTVVEVICEPETCGPILTTIPVDTTGHDCCWTIDFSNPNDDIINAIEFTALDGISIDYTPGAGYEDIGNNLTSVLLIPDPLGSFPADVPGLVELCLNNVYTTPQTVLVDYYDAGYDVFCTDTLRFDCPPEPSCLVVLSDTLVCDSLNGYRYDLNIQSPPGSDFGIGLLKMTVTSPPELAGTYSQTFTPPLANGQFASAAFNIPGSSTADSLCFVLSAHNGPGEELCCFVQDTCLALPVCDPCPQVTSSLKPVADSCCYQLDLVNNYADAPNFFTEVQTTLLEPGVFFTSVEYDLANPWQWQALGTDDNDLLWTFNGGVPQGTNGIFEFCVGGVTTTDSVCMEVAWINREEIVCRDTVKIFCPSCILITQDTLTCDPATNRYTYTFSGENWSGGQDANTISLLESDPGFDLSPTTLDLGGTIPPLGSFGPVSFDIIPTGAQPGDTLCFDMVLRNVIQDSINIECCYVTHCIVLPECAGGSLCDELVCVAPPPVNLSCEDLPPGFIATDPTTYPGSWGEPLAAEDCPVESIEETVATELDLCNVGTILRSFTLTAPDGVTSTNPCTQLITLEPGLTSYSLRFPADLRVSCGGVEDIDFSSVVQVNNGCNQLAVTLANERVLPPENPDECFRLEREITVIDWCAYDMISPPVVLSRDEDCNGVPGEQDVWLHLNAAGTFVDSDADPNNGVPAAGVRGTSCDGQTNPAGHWRSSSTHPALAANGYWSYTQVVEVTDATWDYSFSVDRRSCADPISCTAEVPVSLSVAADCPYTSVSTFLTLDVGADGMEDATAQLEPDGTNTILSGQDLLDISGAYPDWEIRVNGAPLGSHELIVQGESECGSAEAIVIPFLVVDCEGPQMLCQPLLSVELEAVVPPTDVNGDGVPDLAAVTLPAESYDGGSFDNCSPPVFFSINRPGEEPDPMQTSIILTCDDLGIQELVVQGWDAAGQNNSCIVDVVVNDPADHCSGNRAASRNLVLYPNPVRAELVLRPPQVGKARVQVLSSDGQNHLQLTQQYTSRSAALDVARLRPGLYWLRLQYTDGKIFYQRFIKH